MVKSNSKKNTETEELILDAAKDEFENKGYSGARMQAIADVAGINKALLHYYYRSKEKLFQHVFGIAFKQITSKLQFLGDKDMSIYEKIDKFYNIQLSILMKNPKLPNFILNELEHNPELVLKTIKELAISEKIKVIKQQIEEEMEQGNLIKIPPEQFMVNIVSLSIFPFASGVMISEILQISPKEYKLFLKNRKQLLSNYVLQAIRKK